jgi:cytochrome b561
METHNLERKKVFGGVQRLLHAWIGLAVLSLLGLGWAGKFMDPGTEKLILGGLHITLGYGLLLGLVLRIVWGFIGPQEARFFTGRSKSWGHERMASISYLLFYFGLGVACLSGLVLAAIQYDRGIFAAALFDDFTWHEISALAHDLVFYAVTAFIVLHIGALIFHENERGHPLAQAMLSGYQYRLSSSEAIRDEENHPFRSHPDN